MEFSGDQVLASAARFLIDGGEEDAASVLLSCNLSVWESGDTWCNGDEVTSAVHVDLTGPRAAWEVLSDDENPIRQAVYRSIQAVLPENTYIRHFSVRAELVDLDPDWRTELLEIARGRGVHNQAGMAKVFRVWNNLRFRSQSEIRVAQALDQAGVLFLPNCLARLGGREGRRNREADFLICHQGSGGSLRWTASRFTLRPEQSTIMSAIACFRDMESLWFSTSMPTGASTTPPGWSTSS